MIGRAPSEDQFHSFHQNAIQSAGLAEEAHHAGHVLGLRKTSKVEQIAPRSQPVLFKHLPMGISSDIKEGSPGTSRHNRMG
jgi:hypothetical protein